MHTQKGFTLIELLIVIAIIGMLAGIVVASVNGSRANAATTAGKKFANSMHQALGDGLIADYAFDDCSGTTPRDSAAFNAGTLTASPVWNTAPTLFNAGCELQFNGSNYMTITDNDVLDYKTGSMTWSLFFKTSATTRQILLRKWNTGAGFLIELDVSGYPRCILYGPSASITTTQTKAYNNGNWHHLGCTFDRANNRLKLFMDGTLVATGDTTTAIGTNDINSTGNTTVGYSGALGVNGYVDNVRVYNKAFPGE